jgi:hypothetical protein
VRGGGHQPFGEAFGVASMKADASFDPGETAISATVTASWQLQL